METQDKRLQEYIRDNWRSLAEDFISMQESEFLKFCKEDYEMTNSNKKEIVHMGNDNRCDTCFKDGIAHQKSKEAERIERILSLIDSCVISLFEGHLTSGKDLTREEVMGRIRTQFNKTCNQIREKLAKEVLEK